MGNAHSLTHSLSNYVTIREREREREREAFLGGLLCPHGHWLLSVGRDGWNHRTTEEVLVKAETSPIEKEREREDISREMRGRLISFLSLALAPIEDTDDITNDARAAEAKQQQRPQQEEEEEEEEQEKHASHHYSCCLFAASAAMHLH